MELLKIETPRLLIRNLKETDLDDFYSYRSNKEVVQYQGFDMMNMMQCKEFIESQLNKEFGKGGEWVQYGIELKETQKIIGDCAIKLDAYDTRIAEIGITVSHLAQQKGYAKETFEGILQFLFDNKQLHRVVETADAENIASIKMLESLGFRKEGHFVENIFFKGKWGSEVQYAMLRREWDSKKQTI